PAPEPTEEAAPERQPSPRELAMERILAHRQEVMAAEVAQAEVLAADARELAASLEPSAPEPEPTQEAAPEPVAPPVPAAAPAQPQAPAAPVLHIVDVPGYGRMQVTQDQLLQLASIGAVANAALRQPPTQAPAEPPAPVAPAPVLDDERARAFARTLAFGDEEASARAVQALVADVTRGFAAPAVNPDAIVNEAVQRTMRANQFVSNMHTIGAEFPDIFGKPDETDQAALARHHRLSRLAALELTDLRQRYAALGQTRPDLDLYREAANNVRTTIGTPPQPKTETEPPALQAAPSRDRLERKRAAPQNPTAVSRTASLGPAQPQGMTGSQIVDAMRKARGQMPLH
ncbi:MAG TPA: hypothetical protein VN692_09015, partial [Steroidobacteraceae bacterium]|nr:hypothetical protein [Steroidobacteraceae bacterium]